MAKAGEGAVWFQPLRLANAELLERHLYQVADAVIEAHSGSLLLQPAALHVPFKGTAL